ncbi:MAG: hypothetical protein AAF570_19915, partial [Bacteroidota bacterium]
MTKMKGIPFSFLSLFVLFLLFSNGAQAQIATTGVGAYGTWPLNPNFAAFGHVNYIGTSGYALLQQNTGQTFVNAANGQNLRLRIGNTDAMVINSNKRVGIG